MPSSDPCNIPHILNICMRIKPKSILDVGVGCGKYALLFREYLDGHRQGAAFHDRQTWKMKLFGVEVFAPYITPVHQYLYDKILVGNYWNMVGTGEIPECDIVFLGDVLEHFPQDEGEVLLEKTFKSQLRTWGSIIISTPDFESDWRLKPPFNNQHEVHRCRWLSGDFKKLQFGKVIVRETGKLLTVEIQKQG